MTERFWWNDLTNESLVKAAKTTVTRMCLPHLSSQEREHMAEEVKGMVDELHMRYIATQRPYEGTELDDGS